MDEQKITKEMHQKLAIDIFNKIWPLIDKKDPDDADEELLIDMAHASLYHWRQCGSDVNLQRGHWMISHVYALYDFPAAALYHAKRCLRLTESNNYKESDRAYAYEAIARANACCGKKDECELYFQKAQDAGNEITKKEDRDLFLSDLESAPWYERRVDPLADYE